MKLILGTKQLETLLEALDLAAGFTVGMDEYSKEHKAYAKLEEQIRKQITN